VFLAFRPSASNKLIESAKDQIRWPELRQAFLSGRAPLAPTDAERTRLADRIERKRLQS